MCEAFEKAFNDAVYHGVTTLEISCCNGRALEASCEHMVDEGFTVTKSIRIRLSNEIQSAWSQRVLETRIANNIH